MKIDRLLSIIIMLLNRDKIPAKELADKFEVSIRTIYRDIDTINQAGIPIISYQGNNGGFGIIDNYKIDRQLLTLKDIFSILSALKGINTTLEDTELDNAIEKITTLVPKEKSDMMKLHCEQLVIDVLPWGFTHKQKERIKLIHNSIIDNRVIDFIYSNTKNETIRRSVEPMTLIFKGYAWYLFGYCLIKKDFRLFRLSRMKDIKFLNQTFERKDVSYQAFTMPDENSLPMTELVLKFAPHLRTRVEDFFDEEGITIQDDGYLIVKTAFPEDEWVYSTLLSYGENVEVLHPPHIKKIILEKAKKIVLNYKPVIKV